MLAFNTLAVTGAWITANLQMQVILGVLLLIPSFTWIPLMRRFGFLTIRAVWAFQLAETNTPLKATGWVANQAIALHLIPIAVAAWALWVIVSAERRPGMESAN